MKRSEMINIINNILQKNLDSQNNYYSDAVDILEVIEEAGMLPPPNGIFNPVIPLVKGEHKWEPEE